MGTKGPRSYFSPEDDQILLAMAKKRASNEDIAKALNRSVRSVESRKYKLRIDGIAVPNAPRTKKKSRHPAPDVQAIERPAATQICIVDVEDHAPSLAKADPAPAGHIDPAGLIGAQIDELNDQEAELLASLERVRAERSRIIEQLQGLIDTALTAISKEETTIKS